jgi:thymidine phosphorylase
VPAAHGGTVIAIDNRRLARIAKLAGAPGTACAGLDLHVRPGELVERGQPLFTLHAGTPGELAYALEYGLQGEAIHVMEEA